MDESRLIALGFADASVGLALLSVDPGDLGRPIAYNAAASALIGRDAAPLVASEQAELFGALASGEIPEYVSELGVTHRDGHRLWVEVTARLVRDETGNAVAALIQAVDVTDRHQSRQRLDAMHAVSRAAAGAHTTEAVIAALPPALGAAFEMDFAASWMLDRTSELLRARVTWTAPGFEGREFRDATRSLALAVDGGLPGRASQAGRCISVPDFGADASLPRAGAAEADGLRGAVEMPVIIDGELLGIVELLSRGPLPSAEAMCATLEAVADDCQELIAQVWTEERRSPSRELLLVEDNEFIARLVREMLDETYDEPLELVHVTSLSEAAARLAATRPTCVLLDLNLPDASGLEAVLNIRGRAPEVPIVVLTAEEDESLAIGALQEGAQDYLMKRKVDMQSLARSVRYAIERKGLEQELLSHRLRNPLTQLPTRVLFLDQLRVALSRSEPGAVAVLMVDLDRFRRINNSLGLAAGDAVLLEATRRLLACAGREHQVASLGGDTFALLVEAPPRAEMAAIGLATRIAAAMREPFWLDDAEVVLSATVGIALNGPEVAAPDELISEADTAVSRAKEAGGARFEIYDETVRAGLRERLEIEGGLRGAIERGELRLHYQPIFSLTDRHVSSVEALLRWEHPARGLLAPDEFVPIAEESGMIVPVGRWVMREACRQLAAWRAEHPAWSRIAVNVNLAIAQLHDPELLAEVRDCLRANGLGPRDVCVEVTESSLIEDMEYSIEVLEALREVGVVIALDDFGTGYSSLSYVTSLPLDTIKLDRSFLAGFGQERESAIVALVGNMSRALKLPAVAEGIEDEAHIGRLLTLGYDWGQGYALARPGPPEQVLGRVRPSGSWEVPA